MSKVGVCMPEALVLSPAPQTSQQCAHISICHPQMSGCAPVWRRPSLTGNVSGLLSNKYQLTAHTLMPGDPHSTGVLPFPALHSDMCPSYKLMNTLPWHQMWLGQSQAYGNRYVW